MLTVEKAVSYQIKSITIDDAFACQVEVAELMDGAEVRRLTACSSSAERGNYLTADQQAVLTAAAYRVVADKLQLDVEV